jgi:retinol dehydrogenase-12
MACRSKEKALPVVDEIKRETNNDNVEFGQLDLSDWASVVSFAKSFLSKNKPLDVLINNAGTLLICSCSRYLCSSQVWKV